MQVFQVAMGRWCNHPQYRKNFILTFAVHTTGHGERVRHYLQRLLVNMACVPRTARRYGAR